MAKLEIKTDRLVIRPLKGSDYEAWRKTRIEMLEPQNGWDVGPRPVKELSRGAFRKVVAGHERERKADRNYHFAIFERKSGAFVGAIDVLGVIRFFSQHAFVGYRIYNRYWGNGYASEAVRAIIQLAFEQLGLYRLEFGIEPRNLRSLRVVKALGLRKEGLRKGTVYLRGRWLDLTYYSVTCGDLGSPFKGKATNFLR